MKAIWQLWESELDDLLVKKIIDECELYTPQEGIVGFEDSKANKDIRSSTVRWVNTEDPNSKFIKDLIWKYAQLANKNAFGVDITQIHDIQYTIYEGSEDGHYDWHHDTFWANNTAMDRKLSITIQLSDSDEYKGGDFLFEEQYERPNKYSLRKKGSILVFPSVIRHSVSKLTKGTRRSLVCWVEGPKWR